MAVEVKAEYLNLFIKISETGVLLNAVFVADSAHSFLRFLFKMFTTLFPIRVKASKSALLRS